MVISLIQQAGRGSNPEGPTRPNRAEIHDKLSVSRSVTIAKRNPKSRGNF